MTKRSSIGTGRLSAFVWLYLLVLVAVGACAEEEEFLANDPQVNIFFLNRDSLDRVSPIIDSLDAVLIGFDTVIANFNKQADVLADSVLKYAALVSAGQTEFATQVTQYQSELDALNEDLSTVKKEDSTASAQNKSWTQVATVINAGRVKVSSIENLKNGKTISYQDSSAVWKLPLDMHADDVNVGITIAGQTYQLAVGYLRSTVTNEKNKVLIRTSDFEILSTDFKNTILSCQECEDYETTVYVEF